MVASLNSNPKAPTTLLPASHNAVKAHPPLVSGLGSPCVSMSVCLPSL